MDDAILEELKRLRLFAERIRQKRSIFEDRYARCDYNDEKRSVYAFYVQDIKEALRELDNK